MPKCNFNKVSLQLYWNHTSAWVFSCKFVVYFQNTFSWEYGWVYFWMKKGAFEIIATMAFWQVMHLTTWCALGGHIVCDFMYKLRSSGFCMIWALSTSWAEIARKFGNSTSMLSYYWKEINQSANKNRTIIC